MSLMIEHISILQAIYSSLTCYNIDLFNKIHISNVSITNMFFSPPTGHVFLFFRRAGRVFLFLRRAGRVFFFSVERGAFSFFSAELGAFSFFSNSFHRSEFVNDQFRNFFQSFKENLNRFVCWVFVNWGRSNSNGEKPSGIYIYALYK